MEPIAIIGIGCHLPGGIKSGAQLWALIMSKKIVNTPKVPSSRFNIDAHYHQDNDRPGSFNIPGGYFLDENPEDFDPTLFRISPIEAMWMDPQQRKLLEVVYEAFENSGSTLKEVAQQVTGCFVASFTSDFQQIALKEPDFRHSYATTGIDPGILGNRISHVFDLKGPSVLINTACSSSMYALDSACSAIARGECEGAVVGGANLILTVDQHMNTAKLGVLSPTSTCHTFDEAADGYGRAEAVGALYIKSLSAALRDGNPVRAVIRSVATNANGRHSDNGITFPSLQGQVDVITKAHRLANLDPRYTSYIECHGTGTQTGDPIEVRAVSMAMRSQSDREDPILIGSVKPNIGHSEAASSICTIIKAVLALENGIIPPTAGINTLNKNIQWDTLNVKVVTEPTPFPSFLPVQRVGVNAFGYGGTNGHVVLESVKSILPDYHACRALSLSNEGLQNGFHPEGKDRAHLLVFSAHDQQTLKGNLEIYKKVYNKARLFDIAHTLANRRPVHKCRTFTVCREHHYESDLSVTPANIFNLERESVIAFAFTGQGAQWAQMGTLLLSAYPSFLATIRELDSCLTNLFHPPTWSIEASLLEPEGTSQISKPELSQPLCTAIQIALVTLLKRWGVTPVATVGHSSAGEIAAAFSAGYITAREAIVIAYYRGKAVSTSSWPGAMLAVGLGADQLQEYMENYQHRLVVACHNSPHSSTVSGDADAIQELKATLDSSSVFARIVKTGGQAYHSHHMKSVAARYLPYLQLERKTLVGLQRKPAAVMFSTVHGCSATPEQLDNEYWCQNLTSPVLFSQAIQKMLVDHPKVNIVVEIGPHSTFSGPMRQIFAKANHHQVEYLSTLKRKEDDCTALLKLAGNLWTRNAPIDLKAVTSLEIHGKDETILTKRGTLLVDLPPYKWNYTKTLQAEGRHSKEHRFAPNPRHDILGRKVLGTTTLDPVWRNILRHKDLPWLRHHSLGAESVFPAAGYFAMAIEAATQANFYLSEPLTICGYTIRDVTIASALVIPDTEEGVETLFTLRHSHLKSDSIRDSRKGHWYLFAVSSFSHGEWKEHATGKIGINIRNRGQAPSPLPPLPLKSAYRTWNEKLRTLGFDFGSTFQGATVINTDGRSHVASSDMTIKRDCGMMLNESRYVLHPSCIDSSLQLFIVAIYAGKIDDVACGTVLTHFYEVSIWPPAPHQLNNPSASVRSWMSQGGNRAFSCHAQLVSHDGELVADFSGVRCLSYEAALPSDFHNSQGDLYAKLDWKMDVDYLRYTADASCLSQFTTSGLVDLFTHKNASLRILVTGTEFLDNLWRARSTPKITVIATSHDELKSLQEKDKSEMHHNLCLLDLTSNVAQQLAELGSFDLLVLAEKNAHNVGPQLANGTRIWPDMANTLEPALDSSGYLLVISEEERRLPLVSYHILTWLIIAPQVYRHFPTPFQTKLALVLERAGFTIRSDAIAMAVPTPGELIISLAELESPLFTSITEDELQALQRFTDGISSIAWVTSGGLLKGERPEYGMTQGWARVVRNENQLLDLVTVDIDTAPHSEERLFEILTDIVERWALNNGTRETEYCIDDGVVYIGRLLPAASINDRFVNGAQELKAMRLKDVPPLRGEVRSGKIIFQHDDRVTEPLGAEEIEIEVRAIGLNKEDADVTAGSDASSSFSHEIAGIITHLGSLVPREVKIGDRVFGFAFDTMATLQRTRYDLIQSIPAEQGFEQMATIPAAYATALYALEDLARLEPGEIVAIIDGCGSVGLAAMDVCSLHKADVIVITKSSDTAAFLQTSGREYKGIVIAGQDDVGCSLQNLTAGKGVDVVLRSTSADIYLVEECCRNMAPFGRVIASGKHSQSSVFQTVVATQHNSTFTFDLRDLYRFKPQLLAKLLKRCADLQASGMIQPISPLLQKSPEEITEAMRLMPSEIGQGKMIVRYSLESSFPVQPRRHSLLFSNRATYLLVGCLGGLGRSLTTWMISRGAKHLAFLSRSGDDKTEARDLVAEIRNMGVHVQVLRADVADKEGVKSAVATIDARYPVKGVVNAAVVLRDTFFHNMTISSWHQVLSPKVAGSLVLHEIFSQPDEVDFFVMTSSIAATLGASGQSNYAAANAFLDTLARHRRANSLPATSLILPAITGLGYIAENPEIEASIRRRGMACIDEAAMLKAFEIAMMPAEALDEEIDHLIAGLQPSELAKSIKAAKTDVSWMLDPRLRSLNAAIAAFSSHSTTSSGPGACSILSVLQSCVSDSDAVAAVEACLVQRLSRLLMISVEEIQGSERSLAGFGLDSMIGAEFRNWVFREFGLDLPFQQLLAGNLTVRRLAVELCARVRSGRT
ncbi:putative polyketide synthase [Lindgomyces ingoldianus]|uniref:Polyketide synthase n=1 Tax=Lindgomyces ingoldianus TaxID=673940 RepID=A0ACB6R7W6_9PLEO|nr:putative polyketide synthase [Lindgomyces ingoldianus]KAF2475276.1 putative polyketide synthase [Lindgomyces ingoldianus]